MKNSIFKKICAVSLSALMLGCAGAAETSSFIAASLPVYAASVTPASDFDYETKDDGTITITYFKGTQTNVVIPDTIDGKKITEIGTYAFGCTDITNISMPDSVTKIGTSAFSECTNLKSITIPDGVAEIGYGAFMGCTNLKNITLSDSVMRIGGNAFYNTAWFNNKSDGDVYAGKVYYKYKGTMPENTSIQIKTETNGIADYAFEGCTGLTSITIPYSVTRVGFYAFSGCTKLTCVTIPDSVTEIVPCAFYKCTGLKSITIPDSVTVIGFEAFENCTSLKSITIPDSVTKIGFEAFEGCISLKSITIPSSVMEIDDTAFRECDKLKILCMKGSYAEQYAIDNNIPYKAIVAPLKNTSALSAKKITLGGKVTISLNATGGTAPYKYSVLYKKSAGTKWSTLAANTTKTSVSFTPSAAAAYDLKIIAKDSAGKTSTKNAAVTVSKPLTNISKLGTASAKVGEKVKVRCYAQGGTGEYTYAVYYKKSAGNTWYKLRGYNSTNLVLFTPKAAASYDIKITAKDSSGKVAEKVLTLKAAKQ